MPASSATAPAPTIGYQRPLTDARSGAAATRYCATGTLHATGWKVVANADFVVPPFAGL